MKQMELTQRTILCVNDGSTGPGLKTTSGVAHRKISILTYKTGYLQRIARFVFIRDELP